MIASPAGMVFDPLSPADGRSAWQNGNAARGAMLHCTNLSCGHSRLRYIPSRARSCFAFLGRFLPKLGGLRAAIFLPNRRRVARQNRSADVNSGVIQIVARSGGFLAKRAASKKRAPGSPRMALDNGEQENGDAEDQADDETRNSPDVTRGAGVYCMNSRPGSGSR